MSFAIIYSRIYLWLLPAQAQPESRVITLPGISLSWAWGCKLDNNITTERRQHNNSISLLDVSIWWQCRRNRCECGNDARGGGICGYSNEQPTLQCSWSRRTGETTTVGEDALNSLLESSVYIIIYTNPDNIRTVWLTLTVSIY